MEINVRAATNVDIRDMAALLHDLFSIEKDFTPNEEKQIKGLTMVVDSSEERRAMVATDGGRVVGMVSGQLIVSTAEGGIVALIEDLVVERDYRGKGLGAKLLAAIETWARGLGASRLTLLADKQNTPAKEFYTKAGWKKTNLITLHKTKNGTCECHGMRTTRG